jgi:hypothetical protein
LERVRWGAIKLFSGPVLLLPRVPAKRIEVLLHYARSQSGQLTDLHGIAGDFGQDPHRLEVADIVIDRILRVVCLASNPRCVVTLQVEDHDFTLVGDGSGEVVDLAPTRVRRMRPVERW